MGVAGAIALLLTAVGPASASDPVDGSDVCLEIVAAALPAGAWEHIVGAVTEAASRRTDLFGEAMLIHRDGASDSGGTAVSTSRVDIYADRLAPEGPAPGACLADGSGWTARIGRDFLARGAERMLALAPTTPGIDSEVEVEWHPAEGRLRTTLVFAGPLDIPNGTCWIDDRLDASAEGEAVSEVGHGVETSLFAESACERFFDHLEGGGAGEQAAHLLPTAVELGDGSTLHFLVDLVAVQQDAVVLQGGLETR